mgnify:CR=1 FL=1
MNVVYILNTTCLFGGSVRSFLSLLDGLMKRGVNPIVVLPDCEGVYRLLESRGIEVVSVCFRPNTYPHNRSTLKDILLFFPKLLARRVVNHRAVSSLCTLLYRRKIDMVHTNVSVVDIGVRLARKLGVPHLYHVREYGFLDFHEIYYPWPKAFYRMLRSSYSVCITKHIQVYHGLSGNRLSRVIYNGVDVPEVLGTENVRKGYFLYAGTIDPSKGLHVLLEAYDRYLRHSSRNLELWVAGEVNDAKYYGRLKHFISQKGIADKVRFLGGRKDIFQLMQCADAIVIPSRFEGFGRCMAEAMMNRCLVVAHDMAGLKEQFENGLEKAGMEIGLRYGTPEELCDCMLQVDCMSSDELESFRARAYQVARSLYSLSVSVSKIYQFYEDIICKRERS